MPIWPPKWIPGGAAELVVIDAWAVQDGLGIVLVRSFFRLAVWDRFFGPLELLLGRLGEPLAPFWAVLGSLGLVFGHSEGHCGDFYIVLYSTI